MIAATVKVETPEATGSAFHIGNGEFVTAAHLVDGEPDAITLRNERVDATAVVAGWVRLVDACGRVVGVASWKFAQDNRGVATDGLAFFIAEPSLGAALERIPRGGRRRAAVGRFTRAPLPPGADPPPRPATGGP